MRLPISSQAQSEFELHARAILGLPVDVGGRRVHFMHHGAHSTPYTTPSRRRIRIQPIDEARLRTKLAAGKVRPVKP